MGSPINELHDFIDATRRIDEADEEVKDIEDVLNPVDKEKSVEEKPADAPAEESEKSAEAAPVEEKPVGAPAEESEKPAEDEKPAEAAPAEKKPVEAPAEPVDAPAEEVVEESVNEEELPSEEEQSSDFQDNSGQDAGVESDVEENKGVKLAELLQLSKNANGLYDTTWGDKTAKGLFLTIKRVLEESRASSCSILETMDADGRFEEVDIDALDPSKVQQRRTNFVNMLFKSEGDDVALLPWKRGLVVSKDELEDIFRDWIAGKHADEMGGTEEVPHDPDLDDEPEVRARHREDESCVSEASSFHTVQKTVDAGSKQRLNQRMEIKRFKTLDETHGFLNKQTDNSWRESKHDLKSGTYVYAGGEYHNVESLDPSVLVHM